MPVMGYPIVKSMISWFYFPDSLLWFSSPIPNTTFNKSVLLLMNVFKLLDELQKCRPWSDAAFCGVWSGSIMFAQDSFRIHRVSAVVWSNRIPSEIFLDPPLTSVETLQLWSWPRWLSWLRRLTGDQEVAGSTPAKVGNILSWRLIMKYFSLPLIQEGQLSVSGERVCTILVNRLGLSLPSKRVVR